MGPNETASTIIGGPRKIVIFDVQRHAKAQIKHFLGMQDGSRTAYGVGLMIGSRLHRMRTRPGHSIALKALDQTHWQITPESAGLLREVAYMIRAVAHAV